MLTEFINISSWSCESHKCHHFWHHTLYLIQKLTKPRLWRASCYIFGLNRTDFGNLCSNRISAGFSSHRSFKAFRSFANMPGETQVDLKVDEQVYTILDSFLYLETKPEYEESRLWQHLYSYIHPTPRLLIFYTDSLIHDRVCRVLHWHFL